MRIQANSLFSSISKDKLEWCIIWAAIVYCAEWVNVPLLEITQGSSISHLFRHYGQPFVLFALLALAFFVFYQKDICIYKFVSSKLLLVIVIFIAIEWINLSGDFSFFDKVKQIFYSKIISYVLSVCFLLAIFEIFFDKIYKSDFFLYLIQIISIKAIIKIIVAVLSVFETIPVRNHNIYCIYQAYESVLMIYLLLSCHNINISRRRRLFLVCINALAMLMFEFRGAMLICLMVLFFFVIDAMKKGLLGRMIYENIVLFIVLFFSVCGFFNINFLGISSMQLYIAQGKAYNFERLQSEDFARAIKMLLHRDTHESDIAHSQAATVPAVTPDKSSSESDIAHSQAATVPAVTPDKAFLKKDVNDLTHSTFARIGGIILAVKEFVKHPFLGVCFMQTFYKLKVERHKIHSFWPIVLTSYGIIGFIPFFVFWYYIFKRYIKRTRKYCKSLVLFFLVFGGMTFINIFVWWYSLIILFLWYGDDATISYDTNRI